MATIGSVADKVVKFIIWSSVSILVVTGLIIVGALLTSGEDPMADVKPAAPSFASELITNFANGNGFTEQQVRDGIVACKNVPGAAENYEKLEGCIRAHIIVNGAATDRNR